MITWMQSIKRRVNEMADRTIKRKKRIAVAKMRNMPSRMGSGQWSVRSSEKAKRTFANASLDDMIAASRIVAAHQDGIVMEVKLGTNKAKSIAAHIIASEPTKGAVRVISPHQLNRAIIQRNKMENKPTKKTIEIYKKMVVEE